MSTVSLFNCCTLLFERAYLENTSADGVDVRFKGFAAGIVVGVLITGGTFAIAAIPSSSGSVFYACYSDRNGAVRLIDYEDGVRCSSRERLVSWNQTGVQGPVGPEGEPGPGVNTIVGRVSYRSLSVSVDAGSGFTADWANNGNRVAFIITFDEPFDVPPIVLATSGTPVANPVMGISTDTTSAYIQLDLATSAPGSITFAAFSSS